MAGQPMAISDDGALVLLALGDTLDPAFLAGDSTMPVTIPLSGPVSAMALRPHSHDALIAAAGQITWLPALDTNPSYQTVYQEPTAPVALYVSRDGSRFFAAYAEGTVRSLSASGDASSAACPCVPDRLQPLHGDFLFALNPSGQGPVFIYDGMNNRVVFVARGDQ